MLYNISDDIKKFKGGFFMTIEQMKSFSEDKEFINKLIIQETDEDVKKLFKSRGVELTDEDVEDLKY